MLGPSSLRAGCHTLVSGFGSPFEEPLDRLGAPLVGTGGREFAGGDKSEVSTPYEDRSTGVLGQLLQPPAIWCRRREGRCKRFYGAFLGHRNTEGLLIVANFGKLVGRNRSVIGDNRTPNGKPVLLH